MGLCQRLYVHEGDVLGHRGQGALQGAQREGPDRVGGHLAVEADGHRLG